MPTPISISSSGEVEGRLARGRNRAARERHAHRAAGVVDLAGERGDGREVATLLGGGADDLLQQHRDADAAAAGCPGGVLHGDVVVGDDRVDLDARSAAASSAAISKFITSPV